MPSKKKQLLSDTPSTGSSSFSIDTPSTGSSNFSIPLSAIQLTNEEALNHFAETHHFTYQHKKNTSIENNLFLAPIAVLANNNNNFGVFTPVAIQEGQPLGIYAGKQCVRSKEEMTEANAYQFTLASHKDDQVVVLDATEERNWTAMVQPAASDKIANVYAKISGGKIHYIANKNIAPGEQLLVSYDEMYAFNTPRIEGHRYLKPRDSWLNSSDILDRFQLQYEQTQYCELPSDLALFLRVAPTQCFRKLRLIPFNLEAFIVDLPLLAHNDAEQPLAQTEQENITQLMLYCWTGEEAMIEILLNSGANPNLQSSISGYSALHLVIASPLNFDKKKQLIDLLVNHGASMILQDYTEASILHHAIRKKETRLVHYLIEKNKPYASEGTPLLTDLTNIHDQDGFLLAISEGLTDIVTSLLLTLNKTELSFYIENQSLNHAIFRLKHNKTIPSDNKTTIMHSLESKFNSMNLSTHILKLTLPAPTTGTSATTSDAAAASDLLALSNSPPNSIAISFFNTYKTDLPSAGGALTPAA